MISKYFHDLNKKLLKTIQTTKKSDVSKKSSDKKIDIEQFKEKLSRIIPSHLILDSVKPIDNSGFSPEGADFIAYKSYCPDIIEMMNGYVPYELVYGSYFIVPYLDKGSLTEVINKIMTVKKLNQFSEDSEGGDDIQIPSFVIALDTKYSFIELKNDIINYYLSKSIPNNNELDILTIFNKGIVVKNWREKRNYIALETKEDTMMWFFILMNEYLDIEKNKNFDFRNYVRKDVVYSEY